MTSAIEIERAQDIDMRYDIDSQKDVDEVHYRMKKEFNSDVGMDWAGIQQHVNNVIGDR